MTHTGTLTIYVMVEFMNRRPARIVYDRHYMVSADDIEHLVENVKQSEPRWANDVTWTWTTQG